MFLGLSKDALGRLVARFKDRDVALQEDPLIITSTSLFNQSSPVLGTSYDVTNMVTPALAGGFYEIEYKGVCALQWTSGTGTGAVQQLLLRTSANVTLDSVEGLIAGDDASNLYAVRTAWGVQSGVYRARIAAGTILKMSTLAKAISGTPVLADVAVRGEQIATRLTIRRIGA